MTLGFTIHLEGLKIPLRVGDFVRIDGLTLKLWCEVKEMDLAKKKLKVLIQSHEHQGRCPFGELREISPDEVVDYRPKVQG